METVSFEVGTLESLRVRVGTWAAHNFGHNLPEKNCRSYHLLWCAAGMGEEVSELIESGWGLTPSPTDEEEFFDALADICIWGLDFCYAIDKRMELVLLYDKEPNRWEKQFHALSAGRQSANHVLNEGLSVFVGRLLHSSVKLCQGVRLDEDHMDNMLLSMCHVWRCCYLLSDWMGRDLNVVVHETALRVLQRDWKKNPNTAHELADRHFKVRSSAEFEEFDPRTAAGMKGGPGYKGDK